MTGESVITVEAMVTVTAVMMAGSVRTEGTGSVKMMATTTIRASLTKMGMRRVKALDRRKEMKMTTLMAMKEGTEVKEPRMAMREETNTKITRTVKTVEGVSTKMILSVT